MKSSEKLKNRLKGLKEKQKRISPNLELSKKSKADNIIWDVEHNQLSLYKIDYAIYVLTERLEELEKSESSSKYEEEEKQSIKALIAKLER
jgi:hypothetical protein